jgi:hypothetical protein
MKHLARSLGRCLFPVLVVVTIAVGHALQTASPPAAIPVEAISAILDSFRAHNIVALGESHGNEQIHEFRLRLIRDPRFAGTVTDIVVECGNARYQDVMDRFIRGEDVPYISVRQAWQNTAGSPATTCDLPINEEFMQAIRAVNAGNRNDRQLRVVLGDPPIDWDSVKTTADHQKWIDLRDRHAADVIQREVLDKRRRALVIYGGAHLMRKGIFANYGRDVTPVVPLIDWLIDRQDARIFSIWGDHMGDFTKIQPDVASWPAPSLTVLRGTTLGAADFQIYWDLLGLGSLPRYTMRDGKQVELSKDQWRSRRMDEQFDALLYLGPPSSMTASQLSPQLCADEAYMKMRLERMAIFGLGARLKAYCTSVLTTK